MAHPGLKREKLSHAVPVFRHVVLMIGGAGACNLRPPTDGERC